MLSVQTLEYLSRFMIEYGIVNKALSSSNSIRGRKVLTMFLLVDVTITLQSDDIYMRRLVRQVELTVVEHMPFNERKVD
jgi:hypothetical protein